MKRSSSLRSSGEVARLVGIPRWKLIHLIETGILPDASFVVPGRRLFTDQDVKQIKVAIKQLDERNGLPSNLPRVVNIVTSA